jgi:MYXO-CTERM domain-containing protein
MAYPLATHLAGGLLLHLPEREGMKLPGCSVFAAFFAVTLAQATILPPTGSGPVPASAFSTPVNGPLLADTGLQNFKATNSLGQTTISGEYRATVYADPNNTFCAGCLDFFVAVASNSSSTDAIERITEAAFGVVRTDVGYSVGPGSNPGGINPATVDRSSNGSVIGFNFTQPTGVPAGASTQVLEIETNAKMFVAGTVQIIDSSVASVQAFAPGCVPEASSISMTLLGGAGLGLGFLLRRRRSRVS